MATRRYRTNQIKHIPKHKKARLRKNRKGFRQAVFRDYDKNGVAFRVTTLTIFGGSLFITVTSMLFEIWRG
jgi:hypothetical protein